MSNPFSKVRRKPLPATIGLQEIVSSGTAALEALPDFLEGLEGDPQVAEILIQENRAITVTVSADWGIEEYGWNGEKWVPITY